MIILDEAVVRRTVGGRQVMRAQLQRLIEASALPNLTLRLLPFAVGAHAGMDGTFVIFSYEKPEDHDMAYDDPDVVFIENLEGDIYLEKSSTTERHNRNFERLLDVALDPVKSTALLSDIADELRQP